MRMIRSVLVLLVSIFFVAACVSFSSGESESTDLSPPVAYTIGLFEQDAIGQIVSLSSIPFLFDTEVLVRESDVRIALESLARGTAHLQPLAVTRISGATALEPIFGSGYDVRAFADAHLPENAWLVTLDAVQGEEQREIRLLLGERIGAGRAILGVHTR